MLPLFKQGSTGYYSYGFQTLVFMETTQGACEINRLFDILLEAVLQLIWSSLLFLYSTLWVMMVQTTHGLYGEQYWYS